MYWEFLFEDSLISTPGMHMYWEFLFEDSLISTPAQFWHGIRVQLCYTGKKQERPGNALYNVPTARSSADLRFGFVYSNDYCVGCWFGIVRFALLLAIVICWVDHCFVLLGSFCLLLQHLHNQTHPDAFLLGGPILLPSYWVVSSFILPSTHSCSQSHKECTPFMKGRSHTAEERISTHTDPMHPASHHCSHTRTASLHSSTQSQLLPELHNGYG